MKKIVMFGIVFFSISQGWAQVKHNFEMGPEKTDCDALTIASAISADSALHLIKQATFRLEGSMKISRHRKPQQVSFHSCDGQSGFLIAHETETDILIFSKIPATIWQKLTNTNDPITFYADSIKSNYTYISK